MEPGNVKFDILQLLNGGDIYEEIFSDLPCSRRIFR